MPITVTAYYNISEQAEMLQKIYKDNEDNVFFIVPSGLDSGIMEEIICGGETFFGAAPRVMTIGGLFEEFSHIEGTKRRVIDPPDHKLILRYLLSQFFDEERGKGRDVQPGLRHKGFVSVLGDNIKNLIAEGITPNDFSDFVCGDTDSDVCRIPEELLSVLYGRYMDYLDEFSLADASQLPSLAASMLNNDAIIRFVSGKKFVFAGFLSYTGSQKNFIKRLADASELIMLQPETGLNYSYDGIRQLNKEYSSRPKWNVPVKLFEAGNSSFEPHELAREIALWRCGKGGFCELGELDDYGDIGIMTVPAQLQRMGAALSRYKIPYCIKARGTADETLLGELPQLIANSAFSDRSFRSTSILLSNPLLFSSSDNVCAEYDAQKFPQGDSEWHDVLNDRDRKKFDKIGELCRKFSEKDGLEPVDVLREWQNFLNDFDVLSAASDIAAEESRFDDDVKYVSYSLHELEKKIRNLSDLSKDIGPAAHIKLTGAECFAFITDWARTATLPIQFPQSRSVTLYCGMPPALTEHKFWIMTGVDGNVYPGVLRESMLLSNENIIKLNSDSAKKQENHVVSSHLPDLSEEREQKEAIFRRLAATGKTGLILSRALNTEKFEEIPTSPFAENLFASGDNERVWRNMGKISYTAEDILPDGTDVWFCEAEEPARKDIYSEISRKMPEGHFDAGEDPKVRISSVDTFAKCPYRYWCENILRLEMPQKTLFDVRTAGTLSHKVWEEAINAKRNDPDISIYGYVRSNWDRIRDTEYKALGENSRLAASERKLKDNILKLAELLDEIEKNIKDNTGVTPETETERQFDDFNVDGVIFRGKADRIDYYDNDAVIIDYKSGESKSHKDELQIPFYAMILRSMGKNTKGIIWFGQKDTADYCIFEEDDKFYSNIYKKGSVSKESIEERLRIAEDKSHELAKTVKSGNYLPAYATEDGKQGIKNNACKYCPYFVMCRRRELVNTWDEDDEEGETNE
ncbi:MAG: PD-(D/E)XK nuclease family protein [Synergistes sp.]|nr:PD-(D/E)XK nuclease family protein [Synergistes sp.]